MALTAQEIQEKGFEHSLRGYDVEQVDNFLEYVAIEVANMTAELAALRQQASVPVQTDAFAPISVPVPAAPEVDEAAIQARIDAAVAAAISDAQTRISLAEAKVAQAEAKLAEKDDMSATIAAAFISAQRSADALKEEARAEGERIYREADAKAREFIREALTEKQRILAETEGLKISCNQFRTQYQRLIEQFAAESSAQFASFGAEVSEEEVDAALPKIEEIEVAEEAIAGSNPLPVKLTENVGLELDDSDLDEDDDIAVID